MTLNKNEIDVLNQMEELILKYFGEKCDEFYPLCVVCQIWNKWLWIKETIKNKKRDD